MNRKFVILVSAVAALGGLLFGFDTAIISGAIPFITPYFRLDEYLLGWAVSCILVGCAAGALGAGPLADRWGRKKVLLICAFLFALSGLGAGLSHHLVPFILFRLAGGLGVGAAAMVSPMYISEMAPASWRGRLVAFYQLAIVLGILTAYFSNYLFSDMGAEGWRWMFASQAFPSLLFALLLLAVPETPRWLIRQGRHAEARTVLQKTSGDFYAEREMRDIEQSFSNHPLGASSSTASVFQKAYRPVLLVGILLAVIQQVTGINSILYYAPVIFQQTGLSGSSSMLQTISIGVINVVSTFIAIGLVDRLGRKKFLLIGSFLMGLSLVTIAICFHFQYFDHYFVLISMLLYVGAFGCTLGAVTWVYLSEIFPNRVRGMALSVATLALWLADFIVTYTFPMMNKHLGIAQTLLCYATLCILAFFYMYRNIRETKGRSLEEIELLFTK